MRTYTDKEIETLKGNHVTHMIQCTNVNNNTSFDIAVRDNESYNQKFKEAINTKDCRIDGTFIVPQSSTSNPLPDPSEPAEIYRRIKEAHTVDEASDVLSDLRPADYLTFLRIFAEDRVKENNRRDEYVGK